MLKSYFVKPPPSLLFFRPFSSSYFSLLLPFDFAFRYTRFLLNFFFLSVCFFFLWEIYCYFPVCVVCFLLFFIFPTQSRNQVEKVPFCWKAKIDKGANDNIPSVCADDIDVTVKNKSFSFSAFSPQPPCSDPEIRKKNRTEFLLAFSFPTHKGKQITVALFWNFPFRFNFLARITIRSELLSPFYWFLETS